MLRSSVPVSPDWAKRLPPLSTSADQCAADFLRKSDSCCSMAIWSSAVSIPIPVIGLSGHGVARPDFWLFRRRRHGGGEGRVGQPGDVGIGGFGVLGEKEARGGVQGF